MANFWNKRWNVSWSTVILAAVGIILLVLVWVSNPLSKGCSRPVHSDTVRTSDTQWLAQPTRYITKYVPVKARTEKPDSIPQEYQPSSDSAQFAQQYRDLLDKHFSTNYYNDTITLRDSSGRDVGKVRIGDRVTQNALLPRDVNYNLQFPVITNTVTITQKEAPRTQLYLGTGVTGTPQQIVNGAYVSVLLKNKRDNMFGVQGGFQKNPTGVFGSQFGAAYYQKLSFRKK